MGVAFLELRRSEPYPGVGQDEPRMLRSLLGAARRYSFFSLSSLTLLSIYLFGNLLFVRLIFLRPSLPSFISLSPVSFFLYAVYTSHLRPSLRSFLPSFPPLLSSSSSRARTSSCLQETAVPRTCRRVRRAHAYAWAFTARGGR